LKNGFCVAFISDGKTIFGFLCQQNGDFFYCNLLNILPKNGLFPIFSDKRKMFSFRPNFPGGLFTENKDDRTDLMKAVGDPNGLEKIKALLEAGEDVEATDSQGRTALMFASQARRVEIVKYLVEKANAKINTVAKTGSTPLLSALNRGHIMVDSNMVDTVWYLIKAGADIHAIHNGQTTLMLAVQNNGFNGIVKYLVEQGVDVNATDKSGCTALYYTLKSGSSKADVIENVMCLLKSGAKIDITHDRRETTLMSAAGLGYIEIVECLVKFGADVKVVDKMGNTALKRAAQSGSYEVVRYLVEQGADLEACNKGTATPLIIAAMCNFPKIVEYLVKVGAKLDAQGFCGRTALMEAILTSEHTQHNDPSDASIPEYSTLKASLEVMQCLVENGASLDAVDDKGATALMYACDIGNVKAVQYLLSKGVALDAKSSKGHTALMYACISGNTEIVKYLVGHGANANITDGIGYTPLVYSCEFGHIELVKYLVEEAKADMISSANIECILSSPSFNQSNWSTIVSFLKEKGLVLDENSAKLSDKACEKDGDEDTNPSQET
jgi:ankyrin repeat protein